ncbi:MAG: hydroxymethylglutaryl-CoA lyase [Thermodesulfobacteriota bacterium]|nr:hydroxymethylglutaryl-CoA lyase [Thermodesulfobacteriota bacterium]
MGQSEHLPDSVTVIEVGPRDGFQNVKVEVPTEEKVRIINLLSTSGLKRIEATSFTHPKWIPQLKDAAEVVRCLNRGPDVVFSALIPNEKGLDRAIENGVEEVVFVVSASDTLNRENFNKSTANSLAELADISQKAKRNGVRLRGAIAASFGCPFEGSVAVEKVIYVAKAFQKAGVGEVSLADTTGMAHPLQVRELLCRLFAEFSDLPLALHFHDTRRIGLVNVYSAWQVGARIFESSIAGLGGCPYAPGAPGNVATESLVYMFHRLGVETGIDLESLMECSRITKEVVGSIDPERCRG